MTGFVKLEDTAAVPEEEAEEEQEAAVPLTAEELAEAGYIQASAQ